MLAYVIFKVLLMLRYYLFGCLTVTPDGDFQFKDAPEGTWVKSHGSRDWVAKKKQICDG